MRTLATAIGVFTLLPSKPRQLDRKVAGRIVLVFPVIGAILGLIALPIAAGFHWLGQPMLAAALALTGVAICTGALHLDGLADTADGLGSRQPAERALEIMRKSDVGPMGVAALCLSLILQVAALSAAPTTAAFAATLVAGLMVSRAVCLAATTTGRPAARPSGFGALFAAATTPGRAAMVGLATGGFAAGLIAWATGGTPGLRGATVSPGFGASWALIAIVASYAAGLAAAAWFRRRLGGLTGDTFGAIIEISGTAFWLAMALAW